ncbi:uncharacterized protein EDB91DRAFT_655178 [Suillus paluster]|uniref:uncharacterized protein n=1 Tax=Suillus paluster TaxID=48578 RepID=UPI001B866D9B|nr:uncharacterized protein EDB91DRAFT_655178 [Suillus paluster]KAG1733078.1 hypothetical protein EDB91DRAFT_655178 [Suillus paluster]
MGQCMAIQCTCAAGYVSFINWPLELNPAVSLSTKMSSSAQDQIDLGNTFGALFVGVILASVLFGLSNVQAFLYFQTHRGTGISFHILAVILLCALTDIVWSFKLQIVIDVLLVYGVQVMYAYRIWIISKGRSRTVPIIVWIIVVLISGPAIFAAWSIYQCHVFTDLVKFEWVTFMVLGTTTFLDLVIASSLCYLLATSRTGFSSTDSFITKLMGYIINTGCLTSMCSMAAIITCAVMPSDFIFLGRRRPHRSF